MSNTPDDVYNLDDQQRQVAKAQEHDRLAEQIAIDDLKWLMNDKRGRRIVHRLLEQAGVWRLSFSTDTHVMSFNEGNRNGGLRLLAQVIQHCPEQYTKMLSEHRK